MLFLCQRVWFNPDNGLLDVAGSLGLPEDCRDLRIHTRIDRQVAVHAKASFVTLYAGDFCVWKFFWGAFEKQIAK